MKQRWILIGTLGLTLVTVLASIRFVAYPLFVGHADKVQITVTQEGSAPTTTIIFAQQFTRQAQKMLTQITSGVQITTWQHASCPAGSSQRSYYHYDFVFSHMNRTIVTGSVAAQGCALIALKYLDGSTVFYAWETPQDVSLWDVLNQLGNVPRPINMCTNSTCH